MVALESFLTAAGAISSNIPLVRAVSFCPSRTRQRGGAEAEFSELAGGAEDSALRFEVVPG